MKNPIPTSIHFSPGGQDRPIITIITNTIIRAYSNAFLLSTCQSLPLQDYLPTPADAPVASTS